jgi:dihydrofolate synthase/folylpolyglutamate synthase
VFALADEEKEDTPTEFEILTAIAMKYFAEKNLDFVVLETGLGGRFDSTNVSKNPLLSIITSISKDHCDELGESEEEIAFEKSGIIKNGSPVVSNVKNEKARKVIAKIAYEKKAPFIDISQKQAVDMTIFNRQFPLYQKENIKTALYAIKQLEEFSGMSREAITKGIENANPPGRFEKIAKVGDTDIVLDGAHNEDGIKTLVETVKNQYCAQEQNDGKKILLVLALLADKNIQSILAELSVLKPDVIATQAKNKRTMDAEKLSEIIQTQNGLTLIGTNKSPSQAMLAAIGQAKNYDLILGVGSFYLLGSLHAAILSYRDTQTE